MKFEINNNHPLCGLAPLIAQYCSAFTKHHNLSYFQYLRCFADGSIVTLSDRQRRFVVRGKFGESYLTTQEIFCLQFLDQGKSYKEISDLLEISPRTIETYLGRIKLRTGLKTREQVLLALSTC